LLFPLYNVPAVIKLQKNINPELIDLDEQLLIMEFKITNGTSFSSWPRLF
jgi:hypothetical protein